MKYVYIVLCIVGIVLPYSFLAPFVLDHGLDMGLIVRQLIATPVSALFGADVVVSSLALWVFIADERRKRPIRLWWFCIAANLVVGVSLALPLFLYLRHEPEGAK